MTNNHHRGGLQSSDSMISLDTIKTKRQNEILRNPGIELVRMLRVQNLLFIITNCSLIMVLLFFIGS